MNRALRVLDRSRDRGIDRSMLRRGLRLLLDQTLAQEDYDLTVALVQDGEMTRLNETILQHEGTTDVITLDYETPGMLSGEVYICVPEAKRQARKFKVPLQREVTRYAIHGVLHMSGYDDLQAGARRRMKREENRLLRLVERALRAEGKLRPHAASS